MKRFLFTLFIGWATLSATAQVDTLIQSDMPTIILPDSSEIQNKPFDSTRGERFMKVKANFLNTFKKVVGVESYSPEEKPKIAFWRSMIIPSFGQYMNHDYWKVPLVYIGAAGGVGAIWLNNSNYKKYIGIVEQMHINNESSRPHPDNPDGYPISINQYSRAAAQYKRWRDFSYIGMGLGWTLFAVEANVSAHLKRFDISDDISMQFKPSLTPSQGELVAGLKLSFTFK